MPNANTNDSAHDDWLKNQVDFAHEKEKNGKSKFFSHEDAKSAMDKKKYKIKTLKSKTTS